MFTSERHIAIIEKLTQEGRVKVKELSALFEVSEDCIRKDLKQLEKRNKCKRTYGGAIVVGEEFTRDVFKRKDHFSLEKKEIAQKAFALIKEGDTIFLDISTTNMYLASLLASEKKSCIVISNMIDILQTLAKNPYLTVIGTGGNVNLELNGFVGAATIDIVSKHTFDLCFMGTLGICEEDLSLTTFDLEDGLVKAKVIENSRKSYIVMDTHKFTQAGNYKYITCHDIDGIITNATLDHNWIDLLYKNNINVVI